jgi:hypothetical protein
VVLTNWDEVSTNYLLVCDYNAPLQGKSEGKPKGQSGCELPFATPCEGDILKLEGA